jgi:hypothetical protein
MTCKSGRNRCAEKGWSQTKIAVKIGIFNICHCSRPRVFSLLSKAVGGEGWGEEERKEMGIPLQSTDYLRQMVSLLDPVRRSRQLKNSLTIRAE